MDFFVTFLLLIPTLSSFHAIKAADSELILTVFNNCPFTIWPAIQPNSGYPVLEQGGFELQALTYRSFPAPSQSWSGRMWARTGCAWYNSRFSCDSGECSGHFGCNGVGAETPVTLAQFSVRTGINCNLASYDVSLVDGFNLPMTITPHEGNGVCPVVGCMADLLANCPSVFQVQCPPGSGRVVACKSGCGAFNSDELCCRNQYSNTDMCKPSVYSKFFKNICPDTSTYPSDKPFHPRECYSPRELKVIFCQ
ncbi:hypothetical protein ACHQM5_009788 [Ranunculus cassubicifolius]